MCSRPWLGELGCLQLLLQVGLSACPIFIISFQIFQLAPARRQCTWIRQLQHERRCFDSCSIRSERNNKTSNSRTNSDSLPFQTKIYHDIFSRCPSSLPAACFELTCMPVYAATLFQFKPIAVIFDTFWCYRSRGIDVLFSKDTGDTCNLIKEVE